VRAYTSEELERENIIVGRLFLLFVTIWFAEVAAALIALG
jgi:hypothetical protein